MMMVKSLWQATFFALLLLAVSVSAERGDRVQPSDLDADVIIVGTGMGGGVALNEILKGDPNDRVLVLESGRLDTSEGIRWLFYNRIQLSLRTAELAHIGQSERTRGLKNRVFLYPQGANRVGGSTVWYNGNEVVKSAALQQRHYIDFFGVGSPHSPANYMRKLREYERYHSLGPIDPRRGTSGLWNVTRVPINGPLPMSRIFCDAVVNATGLPRMDNYNLDSYGCSETWDLFASPNGERTSAQSAFFNERVFTDFEPPILRGPRVTLLTGAFVTRILSRRVNNPRNPNITNEVTGVGFTFNGVPLLARARKAYHIAAGLKTTELLEVSGIGRCDALTKAGVDCVADLPVGGRIVNHIAASFNFASPSTLVATDPSNANFTNTMGAFLPDRRYPADGTRGIQLIFQDGANPETGVANPAAKVMTFFLLRPESSGNVTVRSGAINENPSVFYNYHDPATSDPALIVSTIRNDLVSIARQLELRGNLTLVSPSYATIASDAALADWLGDNLRQTHHAAETAPMTARERGGVVNPMSGAVYTFANLFACDTSTVPLSDGNMAINVGVPCALSVENSVRRNWQA